MIPLRRPANSADVCVCVCALRGDASVPFYNHLLPCCVSVGHYLRDRSLSGHAGLAHWSTKPQPDIFGKSLICATCTSRCFVYTSPTHTRQVGKCCLRKRRLFLQSDIYIETPLRPPSFTRPRPHTNTRRPINLLFDSGFNLLSASPLAGPASQLSGNKEAGVW